MLKLVNLAGGLALLLLGRKLVWCLYWLWCWRHGRETTPYRLAPRPGWQAV